MKIPSAKSVKKKKSDRETTLVDQAVLTHNQAQLLSHQEPDLEKLSSELLKVGCELAHRLLSRHGLRILLGALSARFVHESTVLYT